MLKRVVAVLALMIVLMGLVFADQSLLVRSIQTSSAEELAAICRAYGLDDSLAENELRSQLYEFFKVSEEELEDDSEESESEEKQNATTILIESADQLYSSDNLVILRGNVKISFSTESESAERTLVADKVVVDLKAKLFEASGSVSLSGGDDEERTFEGDAISLDWGKLDIIVYNGQSTTDRKNSSGTEILFYASGKSISYVSGSDGIFFRNGTIATTAKDPYWSITADKLSLSQNDMFVDRAVIRLGRVPIFYMPIFFYPGTTLSFNPAIGISSDRGMFLTTTYEVYGRYPKLGVMGSASASKSSSDDSSEDLSDVSASISSFLNVDDDSEMIRDGFYYRPVKEGEDLGELETWARSSGSYLAVFADTYESLGLIVGVDTLNYLLDKKLTVGATGSMGYIANQTVANLQRFRYTFDFNFSYANNGLKANVKLPILSDPYVRADYLNRNTGFALDALMKSEQYFPTTFTSQTSYIWQADVSYRKTVGNFTFSLTSLKADIDYKLETTTVDGSTFYESNVVEASLPYVSFSSEGTFLNLQGQTKSTTRTKDYTSPLAQSFADELVALQNKDDEPSEDDEDVSAEDVSIETTEEEGKQSVTLNVKAYEGPDLNLEETTNSTAGGIKLGYTYNQTLDNSFEDELEHDSFYTKINGSVYVDASAPGQWFSVRETVKPEFNYSKTMISTSPTTVDEFYLTSAFVAQIPKFGITYNLTNKVYHHYNSVSESDNSLTDRWGEWNKTDITAHNASISKSIGNFTFGFYTQFKPLTEILKPSAKYARAGFTASADFSFKREEDEEKFEKGEGNVNLGYSNSYVSFSLANKYDFEDVETDPWAGYTLTQRFTLIPFKGLSLTGNASFEGKFVAKKLSFGATYKLDTDLVDLNTTATMSFKGENYDKDALNVSIKLSQDKVSWWKRRMDFLQSLTLAFNYDFQNPYRTSLTLNYSFTFKIAEFMDLKVSVNSANKSFSRYYEDGVFNIGNMFNDLWKSFDFFGNGRKSTGFNLSSFSVTFVHYMRDWNLYIDAQGSLTTKYSSKYEWVPTITVYIKWNAIPELKATGSWDSYSKEWT
ncbi:MAG TPA: hypothetical protein DCP98_08360 [Sphaerochaeta sp.]|nr:hypothetical protein [Sphaerochaeta sp.]